MKTTNIFTKVSALFLITAMLLTALTACGGFDSVETADFGGRAARAGLFPGANDEDGSLMDFFNGDAGDFDSVDEFEFGLIEAEVDDVVRHAGENSANNEADLEYGWFPAPVIPVAAGTLTAGEWRDNHNWQEWVDLFASGEHGQFRINRWTDNSAWGNMISRWQIDPTNRIAVKVTRSGNPVRNATVELVDTVTAPQTVLWNARTDHEGMAYLFSHSDWSSDYHVRVNSGTPIRVDSDFMEVNVVQYYN